MWAGLSWWSAGSRPSAMRGHRMAAPAIAVSLASTLGATLLTAAPPDFQSEIIVTGLLEPTSLAFPPDGRMFIALRGGSIRVLQSGGVSVDPTPLVELTNINTVAGERGLVNLVVDPGFATNGYYYVFYTANTPLRDRVSRFTVSGNTTISGSELVVWEDDVDAEFWHHGGALVFGPDGMLYIGTGDHFNSPDSQSLTSYRGKVLRVRPDGTVPADNPFADGSGPNLDAIWARGLRNLFRMSFDSLSGRLYIADVGSNDASTAIEELNLGTAGANYGWPVCEGVCATQGMTSPIFSYPHAGRDASIIGGFVYRGTQFPENYFGSYFFADYVQNWIRRLTLDAAGLPTGNVAFEPENGAADQPIGEIVDLKEGPDGALYYVDLGVTWEGISGLGSVRRIRSTLNNAPPTALASATPTVGAAPLAVSFSSAGSSDPEGQPLSFEWFFGDGVSSTEANPAYTYAQSGFYTVRLRASDGVKTSLSAPLLIRAGTPPSATILTPSAGTTFRAGDTVNFSGTASDPDTGALPPSAFSWSVVFLHDTHTHPFLGPITNTTSGSFTIASTGHDYSGNTRYLISLTVTDADGLQGTASVIVVPQKATVTINTVPTGATVEVDGIPRVAPVVIDSLIGFQHQLSVAAQSLGGVPYDFSTWSDGGARQHLVTTPETGATHTATLLPAVAAGSALRFFGTGTGDIDRVKIPLDAPERPIDVGATDLTLEWWMRATPGENGAPQVSATATSWILGNTLIDRDIFGVPDYGDFGVSLGAGRLAFGVATTQGSHTIVGTRDVADGSWHHVAVTRRRSDGFLAIYVDGALDANGDGPNGDASYRNGRAPAQPNDPYLVLGAEKHDAGTQYPSFRGWLDELRISNSLRYETSFTPPTTVFQADSSTVGLYHFDDGVGTTFTDSASASGGPSPGVVRVGGPSAGPQWVASTAPLSALSPALSIGDVSVPEGNAGTTPASFLVSLATPSTSVVTATWTTTDGTAVAGEDYVAATGTVTFPVGTTSQSVVIDVFGDTALEPNETFTVTLGAPVGATLADATGVGTIVTDDVVVPTIAIADAVVVEGNTGTTSMAFLVSLSAPTVNTVTVNWATADGSATAGSDYTASSGTLTFSPGNAAQSAPIEVRGDTTVEPTETFTVTLSSATNATLADALGVGTITNDDAVVPAIMINDVTVPEGQSGTTTASFSVTLSEATTATVTVAWATANGTATAGSDYTAGSGTLTFTAGSTLQAVTVAVIGDATFEPTETFTVTLSSPINATLADASGAGTITNDDVVVPAGLIAAYGFDEGSGSTVPDRSGNNVTLTLNGAAWTTQGRYNGGMAFNGTSARLLGPTFTLPGAFTLMAWVLNPTAGPYESIMTVGSTRDLYLETTTLRFYASAWDQAFGAAVATAWRHVALTSDGATVRAYLDGVPLGAGRAAALASVTAVLQLGAWISSSGSNVDFLGGTLDEVRIYNRALSQAEIQADMATPVGTGAPDTLAPVLTNGAPTGTLPAGTTQTTLSVGTNEPATCRYSLTPGVSYAGMVNTFTTTGATAHSTIVSGLSSGSAYTYYVRCRDAFGNDTTSDYPISFAVATPPLPDTVPPDVALTSPSPGATVSGTVALTATASDNVGVVGVTFRVDGVIVGSEDTTAPYAASWNTTTASAGGHTITAVARDAAGNSTTSSAAVVTVDSTPQTVVGLVRQNCTGFTNCYTSLAAWEAAYGGVAFGACPVGDLVCANRVAVAQIDGAWTVGDSTVFTINGWTTGPNNYIRIFTTPTARHNAIAATGYRLTQSTRLLDISEDYVRLDGLTFVLAATTATTAVQVSAVSAASDVLIEACLFIGNSPGLADGIRVTSAASASKRVTLINNVFRGFSGSSRSAVLVAGGIVTLLNNTAVASRYGARRTGGSLVARNTLSVGNTTDYSGTFASGSSNNVSADQTAPALGTYYRGATVTFVNASGGDYHLASGDTGARDRGANLSATFNLDIDGHARTLPWDVGADEVVP